MDTATTAVPVDDLDDGKDEQREAWLREHLAAALNTYQLWQANRRCVRIAQRDIGWSDRQRELYVAANEAVCLRSYTGYLLALRTAIEHAQLAMEAAGISDAQEARLADRIATLTALEARAVAAHHSDRRVGP